MLESIDTTCFTGQVLSELDRRVAAALQINGRAPWRTVAAAAGSTESTVARRAARLMDTGELRVAGMVDPIRCGFGRTVFCQLTCEPGTSDDVASRLAAVPQARFVTTVTGTFDAIVELVVASRAELARLLLEDVQGVPGVRSVASALVTRKFKATYDWGRGLLGDAAGLVPAPELSADNPGQPVPLDETDLQIIASLRGNGRASSAEIASAADIGEPTAHRRLNRLIREGCVICGALVAPESMGFEAELFCWLRVDTAGLGSAVAALRARPEVRYLAATAGSADLACELILPSFDDIYVFTSEVLDAIPGLRIETSVELRTMKRGFFPATELPVSNAAEGGSVVATPPPVAGGVRA
jgi:DNA-binding Lrp family transcriptional regulator